MKKPEQPIYDDRVQATIAGLNESKTREELALSFGLGGWKTLDIHMRRKGFSWDKVNQNYIPATDKIDKIKDTLASAIPMKAQRVINQFDEMGKDADPRTIAEEIGFKDHREMIEYMEQSNLLWDVDVANYVEVFNVKSREFDVTTEKQDKPQSTVINSKQSQYNQNQVPDYIVAYLPLFQLLEANKDRLQELLRPIDDGHIPKYAVPGVPKTKSIYMSDLLARLVTEFSETRNLSQREIVEAAIVEYLKQYGFKTEM